MPELVFTPLQEIPKIHAQLRASFKTGKLRSIAYRKYQLLQLAYLIKDNKKRFEEALNADLGRPAIEGHFLEINSSASEVKEAYCNVEKWAKPEKPGFSLNFTVMRPVIYKEAKGVVLIISPFNYPLFLTLPPLVRTCLLDTTDYDLHISQAAAIAAGNATVLKPSESTPAVSSLLAELIPKYLDSDIVSVVNGSVAEATKLLELQWDHIMYTGGPRVAKVVAAAANKFLTPITLEDFTVNLETDIFFSSEVMPPPLRTFSQLSNYNVGKSPVIVDPQCDLEMAARRILWGKCVNAGQTCVAPDYVLVPRSFQDKFVDALKAAHKSFYPESAQPSKSDTFSRIVTPQAWKRIKSLVDNTKGAVVLGGETDEATKFIAPTVVRDIQADDSLMSEYDLPIPSLCLPVEDIDEAIAFVNARDHPLALYVFSQNAEFKAK
ncbi:hypothetical protein C0992_004713, partial [Termitomyces sp. T32_za158]